MVRWLRRHCPSDTGFEIRALAVWGRARYLSVTEAPHNTDFHTWMGNFCFFQTAETGNWTPSSGVKGSGANHYPRAPAPHSVDGMSIVQLLLRGLVKLKKKNSVVGGWVKPQLVCVICVFCVLQNWLGVGGWSLANRFFSRIFKLLWLTYVTRIFDPMLVYCWATVYDAGLTVNQHWINVSC